MYVIATIACMLIIFVLTILEVSERHLFRGNEAKIVRLKVGEIVVDTTPYKDCLLKNGVHVSDVFLRYDYANQITTINFMVRSRANIDFISLFEQIHAQGDILSLTLSNEMNN